MSDIKNILSIAGSDPSGGAGIQADLKTFTALGAYGMAAITGLTAQNTQGVKGVLPIDSDFLTQQLHAVFADIRVDAVKIGMLGNEYLTEIVADLLSQYQVKNIVLDPVLLATSGDRLTQNAAVEVMLERLAPRARVITPNIPEGEVLLRKVILDVDDGARQLSEKCAGQAVLLKGGHIKGENATDILCYGGEILKFEDKRIETNNTHGTGCTLSSAIAVYLAKGLDVPSAIKAAKSYITSAISTSDRLSVGSEGGHGPVNHIWNIKA